MNECNVIKPLRKPIKISGDDVWLSFNSNYTKPQIITDYNFAYISSTISNFTSSAKSTILIGTIKNEYKPLTRPFFPIISDDNYDICGYGILNGGDGNGGTFYFYPIRAINNEMVHFTIIYPLK